MFFCFCSFALFCFVFFPAGAVSTSFQHDYNDDDDNLGISIESGREISIIKKKERRKKRKKKSLEKA